MSKKTAEQLQKELEAERAKSAENIKELQRKLTDKDKATKELTSKIEELSKSSNDDDIKEIKALTETVEKLSGEISQITTAKRTEELRDKYPDIAPALLLGKSDEEIETLVNSQREINEQKYQSSPSDHVPSYESVNEIDEEIKRVHEDKNISTDEKFKRVRELKLAKENF